RGSRWNRSLHYDRPRLRSHRRNRDQLGKRPVRHCRSSLGIEKTPRKIARHRRRYLWWIFRAEVRALGTEIRFGNGPSEASATEPGRDSANQLCGARTTLATTNSVKQLLCRC